MKVCFCVNARNKSRFVAKAVRGALSQTYPCEVLLSDQQSTDSTLQVMRDTVRDFGPTHHTVRILECPVAGEYGMRAMNNHMSFIIDQTDADWIFQSSADDYSLSGRVKVCMDAIETKPCSAVATTMYFLEPGQELQGQVPVSGFPQSTGYVEAGEGLLKLAYGSVIAGYRRDFLLGLGKPNEHTPDVYFGFLAALDKGFYVVANTQHVHCTHADTNNAGFQGKMKGASGDELLRFSELNHYQLLALYDACLMKAHELHPAGIDQNAYVDCINMILGQSKGWLEARKVLHERKITPGIL